MWKVIRGPWACRVHLADGLRSVFWLFPSFGCSGNPTLRLKTEVEASRMPTAVEARK